MRRGPFHEALAQILVKEAMNKGDEGEKVRSDMDSKPDEPKSSRQRRVAVLIIAAALAVLLLCTVACVFVFLSGTWTAMREKANLTPVIDHFLTAMSEKDVDRAYSLFSTRAQRQIPLSELENWVEGPNFKLFQGYESLSLAQINVSRVVETDPRKPQGTVARVTGILINHNSSEGYVEATLEKEDGDWRLHYVHVVRD